MAILSFVYTLANSSQYSTFVDQEQNTILFKLNETSELISKTNECQIIVHKSKNLDFNISLIGSMKSILTAQSDLLHQCPLEIQLVITIPTTLNLPLILNELNVIKNQLQVDIQVTHPIKNHSSLISDNTINIKIIGLPTRVEHCRIKVLTKLDEIQNNHITDSIKLPLELQYIICGRKRTGLLTIIEETSTNIYFPSPFTPFIDQLELPIHITGESAQVTRVKDMLKKLSVQKAQSMYHKDIPLYARKIDWLLLHRRDELHKIMHDNGAYIKFPRMGSGDNKVTVYAENRVNAERTLRALNVQTCQIYEACFYFNVQEPNSFFGTTSNVSNLVSNVSQVSSSQVIFKPDQGCIEVLGSERAIRNAYQHLQEIEAIRVSHEHTLFRVESSIDQRDFISGKKNGKINKIIKTSGAKIKFLPHVNDYNFMIEVESASFEKALDGLTLLQEELPAEISFYVPESYHKRIIGVGGKNIQRIMKKYGVYVKFSNSEEFASLGGYNNSQDNVIARTPMKNQINLDNLHHSVMELIHPKDRSYINRSISVPFSLHASLIHEYQTPFIEEQVLKKTHTQVLWPDAELASSKVGLLGPEAHLPAAINMLHTIIPETYDLHFPCTETSFKNAVDSDAFQEQIVNALSHEYGISVVSHYHDADGIIRLTMTREQVISVLKQVLDRVILFLETNDIQLYEGTTSDDLYNAAEKKVRDTTTCAVLESTSCLLKQISPSASTSTPNTSSTTPLMTETIYKSSSTTLLHNNTLFNHDWDPMHPSGTSGNIRTFFDVPPEQPYQSMSMPPANFGFPATTNNGFPSTTTTTNNNNDGFPSTTNSNFPNTTNNNFPNTTNNNFPATNNDIWLAPVGARSSMSGFSSGGNWPYGTNKLATSTLFNADFDPYSESTEALSELSLNPQRNDSGRYPLTNNNAFSNFGPAFFDTFHTENSN